VIIKGTSCRGAGRLATHLTRTDTNERAEVKEIRGVAADTLRGALKEIEAVAGGTQTSKPFYHASINTRADERLTDEQRMKAIDRLEDALGLTGQPRVVVVHEKEGREHCHIVWSRIDLNRMAAISDSHNYRKHEQVARELEREFGHKRVQGAHVERDGQERPKRTPSHHEMQQAQRTGISAKEAKTFMTGIWNDTTNGKEFQEALWSKGWALVRGTSRDFVALDPMGGIHSVARRIEGARVADLRKRFGDLNPRELPDIRHARRLQNGEHARARRQYSGKPSTFEPLMKRPGANANVAESNVKQRAARIAGGVAGGIFSALMGESPAPRPKREAPPLEQDAEAQRRQQLMRQLSRPIAPETQRDAEIELDRGRERRRGS
jgi:hypothetical protein